MTKVVKKNNKKTNIPVAGWFLILGVAVIVGAVYLVDGRLLKTQVAPDSGEATVKDWESIVVPDLDSVMVGPTELCPSPTPFMGYAPTPSITPELRECGKFYEAKGKNDYKYEIRKDGDSDIKKTFSVTDESTPEDVLKALCLGDPPPTYCDSSSACAWMEYDGAGSFEVKLTGLYEEVRGMYKLVENAYVYPDGLDNPRTRKWVTGVYPSAPAGQETVPIRFGASVWEIGEDGAQILSEVHPRLIDVAEIQTSWTLNHEKKHWRYFGRYLPEYFSMINSPWYDTDWSRPTVELLESLIIDEFWSGWQAVAILEKAEHDAFDDRTRELRKEKVAKIPLDGLDNILCDDIKDMVGVFSLHVSGKGEAIADYPAGGRLMSCENSCEKKYFTNTDIKIEARPKAGYRFREWQFNQPCAGCAGSKDPVCTLQISSEGDTCRAVFDPIPTSTGTTGTPSPS